MESLYDGREQTAAKHIVLRRYLQALAYKILQGTRTLEISYVDAFSGPWEAQDGDFSDTSFMIAIEVLKDIHFTVRRSRPQLQTKCLFIEKRLSSYNRLNEAVGRFHIPESGFHVTTHHGSFEESCAIIAPIIEKTFALIFIDPTGWTGYSYDVIRSVLQHSPGEVLVNFMYDHINRAIAMKDPAITSSFDAILGGPGWKDRLDPSLSPGKAVETLFREVLKSTGDYKYVVSTQIKKTNANRPYFSLAYGTRSPHGLKAFRATEYDAQMQHSELRLKAQERGQEERTGQGSLFVGPALSPSDFNVTLSKTKLLARDWILDQLANSGKPMRFGVLWPKVIEKFALRDTDVKNVCSDLAKAGKISAPWKIYPSRRRLPDDGDSIQLTPVVEGEAVLTSR